MSKQRLSVTVSRFSEVCRLQQKTQQNILRVLCSSVNGLRSSCRLLTTVLAETLLPGPGRSGTVRTDTVTVTCLLCILFHSVALGQSTPGQSTPGQSVPAQSQKSTKPRGVSSADTAQEKKSNDPAGPQATNSTASLSAGTKAGDAWNGNRLKIDFLWCEPGSFTMGSPKDEKDRVDNEDQVSVTLTKGFWLGKYEVTQEQWRSVMNNEPWLEHRRVLMAPNAPACWVSWEQATLFCRELTRTEREAGNLPDGWEFVLPTEAQWEYACRAGTTTKFSFGDDDEKLFDYAWYGEQDRMPQQMHARAVGQKLPNPWGFYDMHGNVVEWCRDWYQPKYPGGTDPFVSTDQGGGITGRGGEWRLPLNWSRSACRQSLGTDGIAATIGFRLSLQQGQMQHGQMTGAEAESSVSLAVISFENKGRSISHDRLGRAISSLVAGNLSQYAGLDVLERQSVQGLQNESSLANQGKTQGGPADSDRRTADFMLTGTYSVSDKKVSVTARLTKTGLGKPIGDWKFVGEISDLMKLEKNLSGKIIKALNVTPQHKASASVAENSLMAVLPFANNSQSARLDDMEIGFAELLQGTLVEVPGIRLVDRQAIEKILAEQNLTEAGLVDTSSALQIGRLAGADMLLTGSFLELGTQLNIQVRIINSATGTLASSARISGATSDFDKLIDDLTRQITAQLTPSQSESAAGDAGVPSETAPPADVAAAALQPAARTRTTLESRLYSAAATRFRRAGNLQKAAESLEQAILLEPSNPYYHAELAQIQEGLNDYEAVIRTGEHQLQFPEVLAKSHSREWLLRPLVNAYRTANRPEDIEKLQVLFPDVTEQFRTDTVRTLSDVYIRRKEYPRAVAVMEKDAELDVARHGVLNSASLRALFQFNHYHATSVVGIPIKDHQTATRKAIEIYERVLDAAAKESGQEKARAEWASTLIPWAADIIYLTDDNQKKPFVTDEQKAVYRKREAEIFGEDPEVRYRKPFEDGIAAESAEKWPEAEAAFTTYLERSVDVSSDYIRPEYNQAGYHFDWWDMRIEAHLRRARLLATVLENPAEGGEQFQQLVREYGLVHFAGPEALMWLHRLQLEPVVPENSVLIWGGSTSNLNGWKRVAAAENLTIHGVRKSSVTLADLAPYRVIVMDLTQGYPLLPSETLAIRSWVASGGSLCVVYSPLWNESSPWIHSALLSFFGMEVIGAPTKNATSTKIVPHPVTEGVTSFTAANAGGLRAPEKSVLIQAGENTILAATEYRQGRVVVSTAGQWTTPEVLLIPENTAPRNLIPSAYPTTDMTHFRPATEEPPLLRQVLRWLAEERQRDPAFLQWHDTWKKTLFKAQQAQACLAPADLRIVTWEELNPLFDQLIDSTSVPELKEESLWSAGESLLQRSTIHEDFDGSGMVIRAVHNERPLGRQWGNVVLGIPSEYFERLTKQYPKSDLQPFALLRLLDCRRGADLITGKIEYMDKVRLLTASAKTYQTPDLKKSSYAHAWGMLQAGKLLFAADEYDLAARAFDEAGETAPQSPEKAIALLNAARSHALSENYDEAMRRLGQVSQLPNFAWNGNFRHFEAISDGADAYLGENARSDSGTAIGLLTTGIGKLETDAYFKDWRRRLKEERSGTVTSPPEKTSPSKETSPSE